MHGFKEYCALLFMKGSLLKDPDGILVQQTTNVQAARQIRFTTAQEIQKLAKILKTYIKEAEELEKSGAKVSFKNAADYELPEEFRSRLEEMPEFKKAFYSLTPGRQRAYILFFSAAKQSATRVSRIEKYKDHILNGKGMDDI